MRAFALTVPAQSTGRYTDVDWDAVLAEYRAEVVKRRENGASKSGASKSGASKSGASKH
jgi:hypothetical protein